MHVVVEGMLAHGIRDYQNERARGVLNFVRRVDAWAAKIRKRGGQPLQRLLLNHFEYATKLGFYRCYANTWIHILATLEQQGLDDLSHRFLRFWHWQNQPVEHADGTVEPDAFCGQVLALHPLSGFLMQDPQLLAIAGGFVGVISHDEIDQGTYAERDEYWELVRGILVAAQRYHRSLETQNLDRGARTQTSGHGPLVPAGESTPVSMLQQLTDCLAELQIHCTACGGPLTCVSVPTTAECRDVAIVATHCRTCQRDQTIELTCDQVSSIHFDPGD